MAHAPTDSPTESRSTLGSRILIARVVASVDDALYAVERSAVTIAMIVMSAVVSLDIFYRFLTALRGKWQLVSSGDAGALSLAPGAALLLVIAGLSYASVSRFPACRDNRPMALVLSAVVTAGACVGLGAMLVLDSSVVTAVVALALGVWLLLGELDRPRPTGEATWTAGSIGRTAAIAALTVAMLLMAGKVPDGYSWAQKFALLLLLWMAFIGASMATHDGRHLTVDAARKAVPKNALPWYNGVSDLVAGAFTAAVLVLAWQYTSARMQESTAPGEIPDWIKVLSIPVSLSMVTLRFFGRAVGHWLGALLGVAPRESAS